MGANKMSKKIKIVDADDVTMREANVLIDDKDNVYYHPHYYESGIGDSENDDPIWIIGSKFDWQDDFNNLDKSKINDLKSFADDWDGDANPSNIHTYIMYYGCDSLYYAHDYTAKEFFALTNKRLL